MDNPVSVVSDEVFTIKVSVPEVQEPTKTRPDLELGDEIQYKTYRRRYLVLFLFVFYSASNSSQWIQYAIIANIVSKYYSVSTVLIDWTSMIFMVTYIPLIFPASYLIELKGLRFTTLIGAFGTCLGSWIKVMSVSPDLFWLTFVGQSVVAVSQVFVLSVPVRLAAVWFGPNELGSACSVGVFGNQLGIAVGFVLPPMLVKNSINLDAIGVDLQAMFLYWAIFTSVLFVLIIFFFSAHPPKPASATQAKQLETPMEPFSKTVKALLTNCGYIGLLISYGLNVGVFYAISTLLNQIILQYFEGAEEHAGRIGLVLVIAGMFGSVVSGVVLDKTHKYKETTLGLYFFSLVGMIIYTFTLDLGYIEIVYASSILLGFFMTGYLPVGFEFAAELTYPEPEGTSAGILNAASQVFGILFTMMYGWILNEMGDKWANLIMCISLGLGVLITFAIPSNLRRQAAQNAEPLKH